ncbi:YxlC family protein [Shouchella shacheensis]|uniref:YxlC family protein n=1 Tax=Shouchella shacheensis TaxID=1649580 RepID=UPI0007400397|nr:YxlC family protein [Shouchella shacheensis]
MKKETNEVFRSRLNKQLAELETTTDQEPPQPDYFKQLVATVQKEKRQRLWKELALFWLVAAVVLSIVFGVMNYVLMPFLVLQVAGTLIALGVFCFRKRRWEGHPR